mmetsp:Transcript_81054/g.210552  ORF Transcript_81054/g.210552 Transcript_81054/m.210552 type:complete len:856 (+) Transcript_81054:131-2698(+)
MLTVGIAHENSGLHEAPAACMEALSGDGEICQRHNTTQHAANGLEVDSHASSVRTALRKAMHKRHVPELYEAIEMGRVAGLYAVELNSASLALDMQRRNDAREHFADAKLIGNIADMKIALKEAWDVGLAATEFEQALRALEEESGREKARVGLRAVACGATIDEFRTALQEAEASGLDDTELEIAKAAMAVEEQRNIAREALGKAVRSRKQPELRAALKLASERYLQDWELFEAEVALAEEERKVIARGRLKDALLKESWDVKEQVEALQIAIQEAVDAGVDQIEVERARWFLDHEERQMGARELVVRARESRQFEMLKESWQEACDAGLSAAEITEVRALMDESRKPAAQHRLKAAVACRDIDELNASIAHALEVGITAVGLVEARNALKEEEHKVEARARLMFLLGNSYSNISTSGVYTLPCDIGELRAAVKYAQVMGLAEEELEYPRSILTMEDKRIKARAGIRKAQQENLGIDGFSAVITKGELAGLPECELVPVRVMLDSAIKSKARKGLEEALETKQLEGLKLAIVEAEAAGLKEELEGPLAIVAVEERKIAVRLSLSAAIQSLNADDLREAIYEGEALGLGLELKPAKDAYALEEKRAVCRATLHKLIQEPPQDQVRDIRKLREAIRQGKVTKLPYEELECAKQLLASEEQKTVARTCLSDAVELKEIPDLRTALEVGLAAGLESFELQAARTVLSSLLAARAQSLLENALASRSVDDLQFAIRSCEAAGLEPSELESPRCVLAFEHLQRAIHNCTVHDLEAAIEFAEVWQPHSRELLVARDILQIELRKVAARSALKQAELKINSRDDRTLQELLAAIREGQDAGLEDWEMSFARKTVIENRQCVA